MKFSREILKKALLKRVFKWVDEVMQERLPADIYASAHRGNPNDKARVICWLREQGYRVVSHSDGVVQIFKGTKLVKQTKLVLELTDPDELLSVAEVVSKNVNIPPPPWHNEN